MRKSTHFTVKFLNPSENVVNQKHTHYFSPTNMFYKYI